MSVSKNPSKLVPTTVSKEELGKLVSQWRPYCLILAFYFKVFRFVIAPLAGICIIGCVIADIRVPLYVTLTAVLTVVSAELLRMWFLRKIPFYGVLKEQ